MHLTEDGVENHLESLRVQMTDVAPFSGAPGSGATFTHQNGSMTQTRAVGTAPDDLGEQASLEDGSPGHIVDAAVSYRPMAL